MTVKQRAFLVVVGALLVSLSLTGSASAQCDSDFVTVWAKFISVVPTGGGDDTPNLQCAIDLGAAMGPGVTVRLKAGTFYTEQLLIDDFRGRIAGAGQGMTVLHSPDHPLPIDQNCIGGSACFADSPPSSTNRYPSLVTVLGDDVTISDLSIVVAGWHGTEPWEFWGMNLELLSNTLELMGSDASLRLERVSADGGSYYWNTDHNSFAGDAAGALIMWSFSRPWHLTNSSFVVADCTLRGSGLLAYNLDRSRVFVRNTRVELPGGGGAFAVSDTVASQVMIEGVHVVGDGEGVRLWAGNLGTGIATSSLWFANNVFEGTTGLAADPGTFTDVKCQAVNNDVSATVTPYAFNDNPCKVVGKR